MVRIVRGPITEEDARTIAPMFRRLRGDRANISRRIRWTFKTKVDPASKRGIERFMQDLGDASSGEKRTAFGHIFHPETMPAAHRDALQRLGLSPERLVDIFSAPDNKEWVKSVLIQDQAIAGMKVAADRFTTFPFHSKNASAVFLYAMQGRKGFPSWRSTTSRDDLASGILASIEDHLRRRVLPPTVQVPENAGEGEQEGHETHAPVTPPTAPQPPAPTPSVTPLMPESLQARQVKLAALVHRGIEHHDPSKGFAREATHGRIQGVSEDMVSHAAKYFSHLTTHAIDPVQELDKFVNLATNAKTIEHFHDGVEKIVQSSERQEQDPTVMEDYTLPSKDLFDHKGLKVEIKDISAANWHRLHTRTQQGNLVPLTGAQTSGVAAFLVSKLAKIGDSKDAPGHLLDYIRLVRRNREKAMATFVTGVYEGRPEDTTKRERLNAIANAMQHGATHGTA